MPHVRASGNMPAPPLAADAVAGVTDPALSALLAAHWDWQMQESPTWASELGDHRFDDRLPAVDEAAVIARRLRRAAFLAQARAIAAAGLGADDAVTLALLTEELEAEVEVDRCELRFWRVSARDNPLALVNYLPKLAILATPADGAKLVARYLAAPRYVDDTIANLRRGLATGRVATGETIRRTVALLDDQLAAPLDRWALLEPLAEPARIARGFDAADEAAFAAALRSAVSDGILPAYRRFRAALVDELGPRGRGAVEGLSGMPDGAVCYRAMIRQHTALPLEPDALHRTGIAEIERINGEMRRLGERLFGTADLPTILDHLRNDRALYYQSAAEIEAAASAALDKARAAIPRYFGILPRTDCVVVRIPDYEAPYTTVAYYRQPHYDGSKPGEYFINIYQPEVRPRFEMEALTYHESIPGHHLQIAIAQERGALPAFRKFGGSTAYVEGWALYTERLAEEMGLYGGDLDRMGMLSYDAWRASRLVVDTGLHHLAWTRAQAEAYMLAHTALTPANISNEVDRYISWPGQALAYKVGQLEIFDLRREAERALGPRFDLPAFHDILLASGAVSLPVLRKNVEAWVALRS